MSYKIYADQNGVATGKVRYQFYLRFDGKRYRKLIICTKSVVKKLYQDWEKSIYNQTINTNQLLYDLLSAYLKRQETLVGIDFTPQVLKAKTRSVQRFRKCFKNIKISEFSQIRVQDFIVWRRNQGVTPATINRDLAVLSHFFTYCIEHNFYKLNNPVFKMKLKENNERVIRFKKEHYVELFEKSEKDPDLYTAILLAVLAGLRLNEIVTLPWSNIDFEDSTIIIDKEIAKNKTTRITGMPDYLKDHLFECRKKNSHHQKVFENWKTKHTLRSRWEKLRSDLSFKYIDNQNTLITFHDLRHVFAQSLRDAGVSLHDIQAFLGHHSVTITERRYAQQGGYDRKNKINQINNVVPLKKKAE